MSGSAHDEHRKGTLIPVTFGVLFFTPMGELIRQEALYQWE